MVYFLCCAFILVAVPYISCFKLPIIARATHVECTFADTPGYALYGYNDRIIHDIPLDGCKDECKSDENCFSFDYNPSTDSCFISSETKSTQPTAFGKHKKVTYYEKECRDVEDTTPRPTTIPTVRTSTSTIRPTTPFDEEISGDQESGSGSGSGDECFISYGPYGGNGGTAFSDEELMSIGKITAFEVRHGIYVDCLGLTYGSTRGECHGNDNGGEERSRVLMDDDEYITRIEGRVGNHFDQIKIFTNKSQYGPFGSSSGGKPFVVASNGKELAYIKGKSGNLIDSLEFYFYC